ncbi:hypothetical protein M7I_5123 [Glarea lozoyensis 74030]|uniref:Uncharacterized protein n=1 Tax=Glarea lozoyensis (strain ATCC 74030 / MF5533) TaxID=1104152 RepID=H0ER12_GLAL7|nr:hypothetical protein M7I_5123 [Glarea lozoyensis 74030]
MLNEIRTPSYVYKMTQYRDFYEGLQDQVFWDWKDIGRQNVLNTRAPYPIFGRGNSEVDMSWKEFADGMADFALTDVAEWCSSCDAVNLFCEAIEGNISSNNTASTPYVTGGGRSSGVSPTVAGVIGAAVTIAAFIIAALALIFFGFRIDRREKQNPAAKNGDLGVLKRSGSGGFKGAEKLASDTDLALKGGAGATIIRHERVGSWELNNSPTSGITHSSLDKEIESGRA